MEKFKDLPYVRPDLKQVKKDLNRSLKEFEKAETFEEADRAFLENVPGCGEDGPLVRCICVTCRGRDSVLVLPDRTGRVTLAALP